MNQKKKVIGLIAITIMLLCLAPLAAQTSKTNAATAGIFSTDVDNYMSVTGFSGVEMEKAFGYVGYDNAMLSLGYARKLGSIYLGTYYNGNILYTNSPLDTKTVLTDPVVTNGAVVGQTVTTTEQNANPQTYTSNEAKVLIGLAGMGFRLGFYEDLMTAKGRFSVNGAFTDATDSVAEDSLTKTKTVTEYTDGAIINGSMNPSLTWGMKLPLGAMTLNPTVTAAVDIYQSNGASTRNVYTEVWGTKQTGSTTTKVNFDNGYIAPSGTVGLGLDFAKNGAAQTSVGIDYTFSTQLYSNANNKVLGTSTWYETTTNTFTVNDETKNVVKNVYTTERTYTSHSINPSVSYKTDVSDRVSFGVKANALVNISSQKDINDREVTTVTTYNAFTQNPGNDYVDTMVEHIPGNTVETSSFDISPAVKAGLTYKLIPGTFTLNAGLNINAPSFSNTAVKTTRTTYYNASETRVYGDGYTLNDAWVTGSSVDLEDQRTESQTTANDWNAMNANVQAGFTLNVDKNIAFDALMTNTGGFSVNATTFSLILTIKK